MTLQIAESTNLLVGQTPCIKLSRTGDPERAPIFVKLENANPSGSLRDRYIEEIIQRAFDASQLFPGDTIALAGINDSAVSAAFFGASLGLKVVVFAPRSSGQRLVPLLQRYGASCEWTDDVGGLPEAVRAAAEFARTHPDRLYIDGYRRQAVRDSYLHVTQEILTDLGGAPLGAVVTSVTTGATYREITAELQRTHPSTAVRGAFIIENEFGTPGDDGHVFRVSLEDAWKTRDQIAASEGVLLSPKGAVCVQVAIAMQQSVPDSHAIVAINPDAGQRYLGWETKPLFKTKFQEN